MRFVGWRGLSEEYRRAVEGHSPWTHDVKDPEPICVENIEASDFPDPLKATEKEEGIGRTSLMLTLCLHELATNVDGALSNGNGQVRIGWEPIADAEQRKARLSWRESGGPPVAAPTQKGFGSLLIETRFQDLDRPRVEFRPEGVECLLEFALLQVICKRKPAHAWIDREAADRTVVGCCVVDGRGDRGRRHLRAI